MPWYYHYHYYYYYYCRCCCCCCRYGYGYGYGYGAQSLCAPITSKPPDMSAKYRAMLLSSFG